MMPLGFAVVPEVYSRYSRSSASIFSGGHSAGAPAMRSWYQRSRPSVMSTSASVRRTTTTCSIEGVARVGARAAGPACPVVRDAVPPARLDVTVEAVVGDVERAADEPPGEGQVPLADRAEVVEPRDQLARLSGPEGFRIALGFLV